MRKSPRDPHCGSLIRLPEQAQHPTCRDKPTRLRRSATASILRKLAVVSDSITRGRKFAKSGDRLRAADAYSWIGRSGNAGHARSRLTSTVRRATRDSGKFEYAADHRRWWNDGELDSFSGCQSGHVKRKPDAARIHAGELVQAER